jgi:ABC-type bacteriocin/lantibiotic exporter with double-glycine peptidase domain
VRQVAGLGLLLALAGGCLGHIQSPVTPRMDRDPEWLLVPDVRMVRQRGRSDCGVAALRMILTRWNRGGSEEALRHELAPEETDQGIEAGRLRDTARQRGLQAFLIEGTTDDLVREVRRQRPVIVGLFKVAGARALGHYEVVVGVNLRSRQLLSGDPAGGWRLVDFDDFAEEWQRARRLTIVVFPARDE